MTNRRNTLVTVAAAIGCGLMATGCSNDNGSTSLVQSPSVNSARSTVLSGVVQDANSKKVVSSSSVTVVSEDRAKVQADSDGDYTYAASNGIVSIGLAETQTPSSSAPVTVRVSANANGYVPTSTRVQIGSTGDHEFVVNMVDTGDVPEGVTATSKTFTAGSTLEVNSSTTAGEASTAITLPATATIKDESGNALTGTLTATVAHFDSANTEALEAFPGTLAVSFDNLTEYNADNTNVSNGSGAFVSGGFTSVVIEDEAGRTAKTFEDTTAKPLSVRMNIASGVTNPDTGVAVKAGDTIPVWSYENDTGEWTYEGKSTVQSDSNGMYVEYQTSHLSYWNLDWFLSANCSNTSVSLMNAGSQRLGVRLARTGGGWSQTLYYPGDNKPMHLFNAPQNIPVSITVFDPVTGQSKAVTNGSSISNLCSTTEHTVTLVPETTPTATVNVSAYAICSNGNTAPSAIPSATVSLLFNGRLVKTKTTDTNGEVELSGVPPNLNYTITVVTPTLGSANKTVTVTDKGAATVNFSQTCETITGTGGSST